MKHFGGVMLLGLGLLGASGCASMRSFFALDAASGKDAPSGPIHNPFGEVYPGAQGSGRDASPGLVLRTKKGDRAVEVELPRAMQDSTELSLPLGQAFRDNAASSRAPASVGGAPAWNTNASSAEFAATSAEALPPPTAADREIVRTFPQSVSRETTSERAKIEQGLGLMAPEDSTPEAQSSYLASLDRVKSLYQTGRYEAGLIETDRLIREYPTAPRVYQMRGTLFDRLGQTELALQAWRQALKFEPGNASLRQFIERREQRRGWALGAAAAGAAPESAAAARAPAAVPASTPATAPARDATTSGGQTP